MDIAPNVIGREQFILYQSQGIKPDNPDPYYEMLNRGKLNFDFLCNEYRKMYWSGEWCGWLQLWKDWQGERWIIPYLCKWHRNIPKWITLEITRKQLLEEYKV